MKPILAALIALGVLAGAAQATPQTLKPMHGVSFHAETKHAVAYYIERDSRCQLVLTVTQDPKGDEFDFEATRFEAAIAPGKVKRYRVAEGRVLEFACQAEAKAMKVQMLNAFAEN